MSTTPSAADAFDDEHTTKMTTPQAESAATTFFDPPAEIRNRVYDMVVDLETEQPRYLVLWWAGARHMRCMLAQVNRQLRVEFLPRWHRETSLGILSKEVFIPRYDNCPTSFSALDPCLLVFAACQMPDSHPRLLSVAFETPRSRALVPSGL